MIDTATQKPSDRKFTYLLDRMKTIGEIPNAEELQEVDGLHNELVQLVVAWQLGKDDFDKTLQALINRNHRLAAVMATATTPDQEDPDPRITTGKSGKKVFRTLSMEDIENFPDIEYLISNLLQVATVSMLFGESSVGKTFIALALALCVAYGIPWLGRPVKQGKVLYIYAEGRLGLKPRLRAFRKHHGLQPTHNIQFIAAPVHLINERQFLFDTLAEQEGTPTLIVIDTYSNCASGTNQNDQSDVERVLSVCHAIAREYDAHVLVVHHANLTGKYNGSAAFKNHVDTMIEASREGKDGPVTLQCEKPRDSEPFPDIKLQLEIIPLGVHPQSLEPITSCVVVASSESTLTEREAETAEQEREKMRAILREHKKLSVNKWITECQAVGISKRAYYQHVQHFKDTKEITYQEPMKKGGRGFYQFTAEAEQELLDAIHLHDVSVPTIPGNSEEQWE